MNTPASLRFRHRLLVALAGLSLVAPALAQAQPEPDGPESKPVTDFPVTETPVAPAPAPKIKSPVAARPVELVVEDEAVQVLQKTADAVRALKSLTMKANTGSTGGGVFERMAQKIEGKVIASRSSTDSSEWVVRATGSGTPRPTEAAVEFDCIWTEGQAQWIDHKDKKVITRTLGGARGVAYQLPMQINPSGLFAKEPFAAQLGFKEIKMEKPADAGGTPCDVVLVSVDGRRDRTRWYFAKSDHLPRKVEKVIDSPMGSGSSYVEFGDIQIDKEVPPVALQMVTPEGYTSDENTAPATKAERRAAEGNMPKVVGGTPAASPEGQSAAPTGEPVATPVGASPSSGEPETPAAAVPAAPAAPTNLAPAFQLTDLEGKSVSLESLKDRVVVLNFWGTWSPKAKAAHAELQALADKYKDKNVTVLAAAVREKGKDAITQHMTSHNYTFKALLDADKIAKTYKVATFPTTIVIRPGGVLGQTFTGFTKDETFKSIAAEVDSALEVK